MRNLPKKIKLVWATDWYDGVVAGLCEYDGTLHYFNCKIFLKMSRVYQLYALTSEEIEMYREMHSDFQKWVGTHWDYVEDSNLTRGTVNPNSKEHRLFYDKWGSGEHIDFDVREVVTEFKIYYN